MKNCSSISPTLTNYNCTNLINPKILGSKQTLRAAAALGANEVLTSEKKKIPMLYVGEPVLIEDLQAPVASAGTRSKKRVSGDHVKENTQAHEMGKGRGENLYGTHVSTSYWCITLEQFMSCLELLMCCWLEIFNGAYTEVALNVSCASGESSASPARFMCFSSPTSAQADDIVARWKRPQA